MFSTLKKTGRAFFNIHKHASAGSNATPQRLFWNALPYYFDRRGRAFYPLSLFFVINSRCNFKCQFCDVGQHNQQSMFYQNLIGQESQDYPIERFNSLIDEVKFFKPFVSITSTEPLLYKPLLEAVEYALKAGLGVNVTTNGYLLEKFAQDFVNLGLTSLCVSLDGPPLIHDRMRGVPGAHDKAIKGLRLLDEYKKLKGVYHPILAANAVITDSNYAHLISLMEHLPLDILTQVGFIPMVFLTKELAQRHNAVWGEKYPATEACLAGGADPTKIDTKVLNQQLIKIKHRFGSKAWFHADLEEHWLEKYFKQQDDFMDATKCVFPWFSAQITARGDLVGLTRCYPISLGNILENHFLEVWNGARMCAFRRDLQRYGRFPACTRCEGVLYR